MAPKDEKRFTGPGLVWRQPYDKERDDFERMLSNVHPGDDGLTIQSAKDDADINVLVRRFGLGEQMPPEPLGPEYYSDTTDLPDLRSVLEFGRQAVEAFQALPARVRSRFQNNPAELWDFVQDPANEAEARSLGLLNPKPPAPEPGAPAPDPDPAKPAGQPNDKA